MFIEREQRPQRFTVETVEHKGIGCVVASDRLVWIVGVLTLRHRLALAETVGHQPPMVVVMLVVGPGGENEIGGKSARALVEKLVESVLTRGADTAP